MNIFVADRLPTPSATIVLKCHQDESQNLVSSQLHICSSFWLSKLSLHLGLLGHVDTVQSPAAGTLGLSLIDVELSSVLFKGLIADQDIEYFIESSSTPSPSLSTSTNQSLSTPSISDIKTFSFLSHFSIFYLDPLKLCSPCRHPELLLSSLDTYFPYSESTLSQSTSQVSLHIAQRSILPLSNIESNYSDHLNTFALLRIPNISASVDPSCILFSIIPILASLEQLIRLDESSGPVLDIGHLSFDLHCSNFFTVIIFSSRHRLSFFLKNSSLVGILSQFSDPSNSAISSPRSHTRVRENQTNSNPILVKEFENILTFQWMISTLKIDVISISVDESQILTTHSTGPCFEVKMIINNQTNLDFHYNGIDVDLGQPLIPIMERISVLWFELLSCSGLLSLAKLNHGNCDIPLQDPNHVDHHIDNNLHPKSYSINLGFSVSYSTFIIPLFTLHQLISKLMLMSQTISHELVPLTPPSKLENHSECNHTLYSQTSLPGIFTIVIQTCKIEIIRHDVYWNQLGITNDMQLMVKFNSILPKKNRTKRLTTPCLLNLGTFESLTLRSCSQERKDQIIQPDQMIHRFNFNSIDVLFCSLSIDAIRQTLSVINSFSSFTNQSVIPDKLPALLSIDISIAKIEVSILSCCSLPSRIRMQ